MLALDQRPPSPVVALPAPTRAGVATCVLPAPIVPAPAPQRPSHHLLILTTAGHGTVEIDFTEQPCGPGTLLWVRPGQALRLGGPNGVEVTIIVWDRELRPADEIADLADDASGPTRWQLTGADGNAVTEEFTQLAADCQRHLSGVLAAALVRHQLAVLLLRLVVSDEAEPGRTTDAESRTFARFRRELERGHAQSRRVEDYAARLDCSVRTLTRASLAVTGRTAKQVVDARVALEARRLLACTPLSVAEIGRRLGFPEPTNFGRFFHREAGLSPGAFRATIGYDTGPYVPAQRRPVDSP